MTGLPLLDECLAARQRRRTSFTPSRRIEVAILRSSSDSAARINERCVTQLICYRDAMLNSQYDGQNCSVARALEVVGERWTLLIVRDAFLGLRRFEQFQNSLGIARNVLTDRLNKLVEEGILERVRYSQRPERYEYRLTKMGRDLNIALAGLRQWGDKYMSDEPPTLLRRRADKKPVIAALVPKGTDTLRAEELELVAGPGRTTR